MNASDSDQEFSSSKGVLEWPSIYKDFSEATTNLVWTRVEKAWDWRNILPVPGVDRINPWELLTPRFNKNKFIPRIPTMEELIQERELWWKENAERWLLEKKLKIGQEKDRLRRLFQEGLDEYWAEGYKTALNADKLVDMWSSRNSLLTISQFSSLHFTSRITKPFFLEAIQKRKVSYGLTPDSAKVSLDKPECTILYIDPSKRSTIVRQLGYDLDEVNKTLLTELLELKPPVEKIHTKTSAKVIADYFRQIYNAKDIDNKEYTKEYVGNWLAYWFVGKNGSPKEAKTFIEYLQMQNQNNKLSTDSMPKKIRYQRSPV